MGTALSSGFQPGVRAHLSGAPKITGGAGFVCSDAVNITFAHEQKS